MSDLRIIFLYILLVADINTDYRIAPKTLFDSDMVVKGMIDQIIKKGDPTRCKLRRPVIKLKPGQK